MLVLLARSDTSSPASEGAPRRDFAGCPTTPTTSPRWTPTSPMRPVSHMSWIRPERSTRSRQTSLPIPRPATAPPARPRARPRGRGCAAAPAARLDPLSRSTNVRDLVPIGEPLLCCHDGQPIRLSGDLCGLALHDLELDLRAPRRHASHPLPPLPAP